MASYSTNEFRSGLKLMLDGDPCAIIENEFVKPGKGQAFNRVKIRNLKTGRVIERTFKSGDTVEAADVMMPSCNISTTTVNCGTSWTRRATSRQPPMSTRWATPSWVKEQDMCQVTLWNGSPLAVTPPNFVLPGRN